MTLKRSMTGALSAHLAQTQSGKLWNGWCLHTVCHDTGLRPGECVVVWGFEVIHIISVWFWILFVFNRNAMLASELLWEKSAWETIIFVWPEKFPQYIACIFHIFGEKGKSKLNLYRAVRSRVGMIVGFAVLLRCKSLNRFDLMQSGVCHYDTN